MAQEEMKKNVEKLDELDDSLKSAVDELAVSSGFDFIHNCKTFCSILVTFVNLKMKPDSPMSLS